MVGPKKEEIIVIFTAMKNKKVLVDDENSEIEIEWESVPNNLSYMFANLDNIKNVNFNNMFASSSDTNYSYMFYKCQNLEEFIFITEPNKIIQISDTSKMFYNCFSLSYISFEGKGSNKNINMSYMFYNCHSLENIYFFEEMKVSDMREMFYNCYSLESLNDSQFYFSSNSEINISSCFYNCVTLDSFPNYFNFMANDMRYMFYNCFNISEINLDNLTISTSTNLSYSFYDCKMLNNFSWVGDLNSVSDTRYMFYNCEMLLSIELPFGGITNSMNMTRMFYNCISAQNITFKGNSPYYPNDIHAMFYNCLSLKELSLNNILHTDYTIDMSYLFYNCLNLTSLDISFSNTLTKNMRGMFQNCKSLKSINLSDFHTTNVEIMLDMFKGCSSLVSLEIDFDKFDTSEVTDMQSMFEDCSSLISLSLESLSTSKVQYMNKMFRNCVNLKSLNFKNINTNSIGTMYQMFYNCRNLEYLNLFSIKERGQSIYEMFTNASEKFTFCIEEDEYIPNIFNLFFNKTSIKRDCSNDCYGANANRVNITEKKLCCSFAKYGDNCYKNCPSKTKRKLETKTCEPFNCTNNKYYNYEQTDCIEDIKGYYINDSIAKTIDKCHIDCIECKGKWSDETTNCTVCNDSKPYIYLGNCYKNCSPGYDDKDTKKCKCFNKKCKLCSEDSLEYDLCESCNEDEYYYKKENDTTNKDNWTNCYKEPENYYLEDKIYKQCYESCKYCTKKGNYTYQYCTSCDKIFPFGLPMNDSDNSLFNCYQNCTYYYYFDDYGNYHCTEKKECPKNFSKLIHGDRRCVKNCTETKYTKYEFRKECYEVCPPDKSFNESINDYFCKITCPFGEPFEMVKEQVCRENCTIEQRYDKECRTNYIGNRSVEEVQNKVFIDLREDMTETFDYLSLNENKSIILYENRHTYEILRSDKNIDYSNNISIINKTSCYNTLRKYYGIPEEDPLYILKLDANREGQQTPKVVYIIYYPLNGRNLEELDKTLCEGESLSLLFPVKLKNGTEYLYNKTSDYFQNLCFTFTSDDGTDMTLEARQEEFAKNNQSLCEEGCEFVKYHQETEYVECGCEVNITVPFVSDIEVDKDLLYKFTDIKHIMNFDVLKCHGLLLSIKKLSSNIGFFTFIPSFIMYFICIFVFFFKDFLLLKQNINDIVKSKLSLKKLLDKLDDEDLMVKKFKEPVILNILQKKGMQVSNNLYYYENKKGKKSEDIKNDFKITQLKKREITINNVIKEKSEESRNNANYISNPIIKKQAPLKNENLIEEKSDNSKKDSKLKKKKKNNKKDKMGKIDFDIIDKIKADISDKEKAKIKADLNYNDKELNDMTYEEALRLDKRTFFEYYLSLLKINHMLIKIFENRDYNPRIIKIFMVFLNFSSCYAINGLFFDDDTMNEIYSNKGKYKFIDQIAQIAYSTVISIIVNILFGFLALPQDDIISLKQEKIISSIELRKNQILTNLQIKFVLFFIISFISLLAFWYYISCFCAVYKNTQYFLLKDTLISFSSSFLTPFATKLVPPIFRIPALKRNTKTNEILYLLSTIIDLFL